MKYIIVLFLVHFASVVQADSFVGGDLQLGLDNNNQTNARIEYWWGKGKLSGYGYQDFYNLDKQTTRIADHRIRFHLNDYAFMASETRFSSFGDSQKFGLGVQLAKTEIFDSIFDILKVTYFGLESGSGDTKQLLTVWWTKPWQLSERLQVYSAGISRVREGLSNFHEPQLWFSFDENPLEVGIEVDIFGDDYIPQLTLKYKF